MATRRSILIIALLALLIPLAAVAQTTRNTGALIGIVKDTGGALLPGVTVTISSPNLQGTRSTVTDDHGQYEVPLLPPGTYRAEYQLGGVKSQVRQGIILSAGQSTKVDVAMELAMAETVTVTASQVVIDPTQTQQQLTLKQDYLKFSSISSVNRSFQGAISSVPEAVGTGNAYMAGANTAQNTFMIDGINALTDPVTHTFASNMVFDAIQEMAIQTFGKDAEYRSSGGTINVITKSGGNNFSGTADFRYSDPDFFTQTGDTYPAAPSYYGGPPNGSPVLKFNKKTVTDKSKQPQATLGGPIMQDRLWFFASGHRPETSRVAANVYGFQPGSRDFTGWNTLFKLTFAPFANHSFAARYSNSFAGITNVQNSSLVPPEADAFQSQHNKNFSLSYDAVLSSKWLLNGQVGRTPASLAVRPMSNDLSTPGIVESSNSVRSANYTNAQGRTSYRNELLLATTYYLERWGTHALKAGLYYDKNGFDSYNFTTGDPSKVPGLPADACAKSSGSTSTVCGVSLSYRNGAPNTAAVSIRNPVMGADAKGQSYYIQDQWNPISPLTIRAGLRYDNVDWESSKPVPSFSMLQPRFGVAYDIRNNGSTIVHAFGGKIMDENQLTLPNNLNVKYSGSATWTYNATTKTYSYTRSTISASGLNVDPNLRSPISNEYSIGFTQRLFHNTSIDITGERRTAHNMFDDYYGLQTDVQPGIFTNCPHGECDVLRSEYRGIVTKIESRPTQTSSFTASWFHGTSKVSIDSTQNIAGTVDYYPISFKNIFGYGPDDTRDRIKIGGYYQFPWQITAGMSYYWDSGSPWSVTKTDPSGFGTEYLEPRGSRRFPNYHQLDMQLQKDFKVGPVKLGLIGSVLNVLNTEIGTGINGNAGTRAITDPNTNRLYIDPDQQAGANRLSPTFGRFTSFQRPRRFEAGFRVEF